MGWPLPIFPRGHASLLPAWWLQAQGVWRKNAYFFGWQLMMRLSLSFLSTTLLRTVEISVALPSGFSQTNPPFRVLWTLHCGMGNGNFFFDSLNAADMAEKNGIAIVAPSLGNGYFINSDLEAQGGFLEEMRCSLANTFPFSGKR